MPEKRQLLHKGLPSVVERKKAQTRLQTPFKPTSKIKLPAIKTPAQTPILKVTPKPLPKQPSVESKKIQSQSRRVLFPPIPQIEKKEDQSSLSLPISYMSHAVDFTLKDFVSQMDPNDHVIPVVWPTPQEQRGNCCGLYALSIALNYAYPTLKLPPARKDGKKNIISLREIAKKKMLTSFGEIFDVRHFKKIADTVLANNCKAAITVHSNEQEYVDSLCRKLKEGNTLIVSCDLKGQSDAPGLGKGLRTHWALIFGYVNLDGVRHFLVTQYGKYYLWSGDSLFHSNRFLPIENPKVKPDWACYKNKVTKQSFFQREDKQLNASSTWEKRHVIEQDLLLFRFSHFSIPTPHLENKLKLKDLFQENRFAKLLR